MKSNIQTVDPKAFPIRKSPSRAIYPKNALELSKLTLAMKIK